MALQHWEKFHKLTKAGLEEFFELEDTADYYEPVSEVQALASAMNEPDDTAAEFYVCRYIRVAHGLAKELEFLVDEGHNVCGEGGGHALLRLFTVESRVASDYLRKSRVQNRTTDFFRSR